MMKRVMKRAVELARKMEGDWQARMSAALKISWKLEKEESVQIVVESKANEWENYGHHRIYVEGKMIVYIDAWGTARTKEVKFNGYYDMKNDKAVFQGGNASYKSEIFAAIRSIAADFEPVPKKAEKVNDGFIRAQFPGYCAETGVRFEAGAYIFYCEVSGGYVLADNA